MKMRIKKQIAGLLGLGLLCLAGHLSQASVQEYCALELPDDPNNGVAVLVTAFYPEPYSASSYFVVQTLNGVGPVTSGNYDGWCIDANTDITVAQGGSYTRYNSGRLFSSCDVNLNSKLPAYPQHPASVYVDPLTWNKINYLLNHKGSSFYWNIQEALNIFVGGPRANHYYPPPYYDTTAVQALIVEANDNGDTWRPQCGDKIGVILVTDVDWSNPLKAQQLLLIEVPYVCTPPTCNVSPRTVCKGDSATMQVDVSGGTEPFTYSWTGPGEFTANTASISVSLAGDYRVEVTDANNSTTTCQAALTVNASICVPSTFSFSTSSGSALDGSNGNIREFTVNGISVRVSAFSRIKIDGSWFPAWLGRYSGGLGVTDSGEGDGSGNAHTVDNIGRDNFVLFEFSQPVVLKRANLGYVVTDSDLTLWIRNTGDPYNNHLPLNDDVLGSFSYIEENLTGSSSPRWADLNPDEVVGNAVIIAALVSDTSPEDQFKIALLDICKPTCQPPPPPCTGSICGSVLRDCDADGSLSGEDGLEGWTVELKNGTTTVATTTDASGNYCFNDLAAGTFTVVVTPMADYTVTAPAGCNHVQTVNLTDCQNKTRIKFGYTGTKPSVNLVVTGPASAKCGDTITYTFYATNTGNTCVYGGLTVNSPLLGGEIFHQTPVEPGQGFTFTKTYVVKSSDPNPLVNTVTATGHPPGSLGDVSKTVTVSTTKTCSAQPPPAPTYLTDVRGCNLVNLSWQASSGATSYNVKRSTTKGGPYTTIKTGLTGTSYTDSSLANGTVYYYVVSAVKNGMESANSNEASAIPSNGLPSPWNTKDIGTVGATGGASYTSSKFTVIGSGVDIWDTGDEFRYAYQTASGNCSIVAKVVSVGNTDPWAKAGVMIRESLTTGSRRHVSTFVTPANGVAFQYRSSTGGSSGNVNTTGLAAPYWVKVTRVGSTFTSYRSPDGTTWTKIGSQTISMGSSVYIGLGVTSHNDGTLCPAVFSNVTATP